VADDREVDERLAALKLDRDEGAGAAQRELDGPLGGLPRHVGVDPIHVGARGVAVDAGLVAAQGDDEDVQVGAGVEEAAAGLDDRSAALAHVVVARRKLAALRRWWSSLAAGTVPVANCVNSSRVSRRKLPSKLVTRVCSPTWRWRKKAWVPACGRIVTRSRAGVGADIRRLRAGR
jgi:hypothetical protein